MINRLITFEGIDGSGKSTQIKLLEKKLSLNNIQYISIREPGSANVSEEIRNILLDKKNSNMSFKTEMLLFLSARAQIVKEEIIPALNNNKFVLCDRFIDSTVAYQGYGRGLNLDLINNLNVFVTNNIRPQKTFIFDVTEEDSMQRIHKQKDRMESGGLEYLKKVRGGFQKIATKDNERCIIINGKQEIFTIENIIWKHFLDTFKGIL